MTAGPVKGFNCPGRVVYGPGVSAGTVIVSGPTDGGAGSYEVFPSQTVPDATLSAGAATFTQQTEIVFQLDVHSGNLLDSSDMAQVISTMFETATPRRSSMR